MTVSALAVRHFTHITGEICLDPTDLSIDFPHGGVEIGKMFSKALKMQQEPHLVRAEEFGGLPVEKLADQETPVFVAILSTWDPEVVTSLFGGVAGAVTGRPLYRREADITRAGTPLPGRVLYFSPNDPDDPGLLLYRAVPTLRPDGESAFTAAARFGLPLVWHALPDPRERVLELGIRQDLTL